MVRTKKKTLEDFQTETPKAYICEYKDCYASWNTPSLLKRHEMTHNGERAWKCKTWETTGCRKAFSQKINMEVHVNTIHLGKKSPPCPDCGRTFSNKANLSHHQKAHSHAVTISSALTKSSARKKLKGSKAEKATKKPRKERGPVRRSHSAPALMNATSVDVDMDRCSPPRVVDATQDIKPLVYTEILGGGEKRLWTVPTTTPPTPTLISESLSIHAGDITLPRSDPRIVMKIEHLLGRSDASPSPTLAHSTATSSTRIDSESPLPITPSLYPDDLPTETRKKPVIRVRSPSPTIEEYAERHFTLSSERANDFLAPLSYADVPYTRAHVRPFHFPASLFERHSANGESRSRL